MVASLVLKAATSVARSIVAGVTARAMDSANARANQIAADGRSTGSCGACPAADKCRKLKDAQDKAVLADHVYSKSPYSKKPPPDLPPGYSEVSDEDLDNELFISRTTLTPSDSNFRAQIYKKTGDNGQAEYVVAFKGTDFKSKADWGENLAQGMGRNSDYYNRAKFIARQMEESGVKVSYTGHSLGGGLASAAAAVTGTPASTYNAAGLHSDTIGPGASTEDIDAYYVPGDALSGLQDNRRGVIAGGIAAVASVSPVAAGALSYGAAKQEAQGRGALPKAAGNRTPLQVAMPPGRSTMAYYNPIDRHGMDWVHEGLSKELDLNGCK